MTKPFVFITGVVLFVCFTTTSSANLGFLISVHQTDERQDADKKIVEEKKIFEMEVDLGEDYFRYVQEGVMVIYDFKNRRIFTVDIATKTFSNDSLFSNIGFRTYEFRNRLVINKALASAKVDSSLLMPSVLSEHLFSLRQKGSNTEISQASIGDFILFSTLGKTLLSYSKEGELVSIEDKKMFMKFFRYVFGGHPQILEQLSIGAMIPKTVLIYQHDIYKESKTLGISGIRRTPSKTFSLEGYTPGVLADDKDPFSGVINGIQYSADINLEKCLESLLVKANEYYQNRGYFNSMLAYCEYLLVSSLPLPPIFIEQKSTLEQNESVNKLLTALNAKSKENPKDALAILQSLEKAAECQGHVIKIFEANNQLALGNRQEAKKLFQEAIKKNPYIAGAYKDLGDLYYNDYETVMAWRCWDVARKIAPAHKMLAQINEFESTLLKNHPEFF